MSWDMWHVCGTGFNVARATNEKLESFILNHEESYRNSDSRVAETILAYVKNKEERKKDEENNISLYEAISELTDVYAVAEVVAQIMFSETGIRFDAPTITDDGEDYVLFCAANPWECNEVEKNLTFESLFEIMEKYADELGVKVEKDVDLVYAG